MGRSVRARESEVPEEQSFEFLAIVAGGRFRLYTDENVNGHLIKALRDNGWEVVCAIDVFPEGTADEVHFQHAAVQQRVLVTNDDDHIVIAHRWLSEGKTFAGLIEWPQRNTTARLVSSSNCSSS